MKKKMLTFVLVSLLIGSSFGASAFQTKNNQSENKNLGFSSASITDGYSVDDPSKIGKIGEFSISLAEKFDLGVEIMDKRTPVARHFLNEDSINAIISVSPTCFQDEDGKWNDVGVCADYEYYSETAGYYGSVCFYNDKHTTFIDSSYYSCWVYNTLEENEKYNIRIGQDTYDQAINLEDPFNQSPQQEEYWRSFVQFDTSSIPDNSVIWDWIEFYYYVDDTTYDPFHNPDHPGHNKFADIMFYQMSNKPSDYYTGSGSSADIVTDDESSNDWNRLEELMEDCLDGHQYCDDDARYSHVEVGDGEKDYVLSFEADLDLKDQLVDDWFAVGLKDLNEDWGETDVCGGVEFLGPLSGGTELLLSLQYAPPRNYALIVAGTAEEEDDPMFDEIQNSAKHARDVFETFDEDYEDFKDYHVDILMADQHYDGSEVGKGEIRSKIEYIPSYLDENGKVFLFFVGHGLVTDPITKTFVGFLVNKYGDYITPSELGDWIDEMESECNASSICIVMDTCYAGHFIDELSGDGRIIITSTDKNSDAYAMENDEGIFSKPFFDALDGSDCSYGRAWEIADDYVDSGKLDKSELKAIPPISQEEGEKGLFQKIVDFLIDFIKMIFGGGRTVWQNPQIEDSGNGFPVGTSRPNELPLKDKEGEEDGNFALSISP